MKKVAANSLLLDATQLPVATLVIRKLEIIRLDLFGLPGLTMILFHSLPIGGYFPLFYYNHFQPKRVGPGLKKSCWLKKKYFSSRIQWFWKNEKIPNTF